MNLRRWIVTLCAAAVASCHVNEYCVNCDSDGGDGDGQVGDGGDDGGDDGPSPDACVPTGDETCNGLDDDCDTRVDEEIAQVGQTCGTDVGECTAGVYECTGTGPLRCTGVAGAPETCNNLDDNCNGMTDEGNPGGGVPCGSDLGDCVAGVTVCTNGAIDCAGDVGTPGATPESCDGHDNDCDGNFDEGLGSLGSCGATGVGECELGDLTCVGGTPTCVGAVGPTLELCDGLDQDCDGNNTNGFNLQTDPRNCGTCNRVCDLPFAVEGCGAGNCTVAGCEPNHWNVNATATDGCEYACMFQGSQEACNQLDEDCDRRIDEDLIVPTNLCDQDGACAGTVATCQTGGFDCGYGPTVSTDANGDIVPEDRCDNLDNDCDGRVDEGHPLKNLPCTDSGVGACQGRGTYVCDTANPTGPVVCTITTPGQTTGSTELCDNVDNDCDGTVDDNPVQDWVGIGGGRQVMKWEASHPDATATVGGSVTTRVCSRGGVQPWTSVTYPQARAACQAIGADLCTEQDWQRACSVVSKTTYPVTEPAANNGYVFFEAEDYFAATTATSGGTERAWVPDTAPTGYSGISALRSSPNSGASVTLGNAATQAPRLDFQLNVTTAGTHYVWARIYGGNNNDDAVHVGINAAAPGVATQTLDAPSNTGWVWVRSAAFTGVTTGNKLVSIWMQEDGVKVDAIVVTRSNSTTAPTEALSNGGTWSYATNPTIYQVGVCNEDDFDTNPALPGDQDDLLPGGSRASCYASWSASDRIQDLSGNAKEWTIARLPGVNPLRGGASNNEGTGITCSLSFTSANDAFFFPNVGFRCCR